MDLQKIARQHAATGSASWDLPTVPRRKATLWMGMKKPATVAYQKEFISWYLTYERRTYRWVQLLKTEALDLKESGKILKDTGFSYTDSAGKEMVEYHIDDIYKAIEQKEQDNQQGFGGNLSVWFDGTKPLIIFGHDESIFKQYAHSKKGWVLPDGVDCLMVLYPQYDYVFLFDHSCGHDKQREDGLNAQKMGKRYGGKQPVMRDTVISKKMDTLDCFNQNYMLDIHKFYYFIRKIQGHSGWLLRSKREKEKISGKTEQ